MKTIHYYISIRDQHGYRFKKDNGNKVLDFVTTTEYNSMDNALAKRECIRLFESYKAICKDDANITIKMREFNTLTQTYPCRASFYGSENRFVTHT